MIKSVQKAMNILRILSDEPHECVSLKYISEKSGIEKSTCSHIIGTLCAEGYITRISQSQGYKLGPAAYCLTRYGKYDESLISVCHPILRWLAKKTHNTVLLAVLKNSQKYIIDYIDEENRLFEHSGSIFTDDIYRTGTGRILLAHMSRDEIVDIYGKYGNPKNEDWSGITSFSELLAGLEKIKSAPYVKTSSLRSDNT